MPLVDHLMQLFRPEEPPPEDPQACREAMVDLLLWTMFVDRHVALAEHETIDAMAADLEWTGRVPLADYMRESTARARKVVDEGDTAAKDYLASIRERLQSRRDRTRAMVACREMVNSDGKLRPEEAQLLKDVARAFDQ